MTDHTLPVAAAYAETQKALKQGGFSLEPFRQLLPYLVEQSGRTEDEIDQRLRIALSRASCCGSLSERVARLRNIVRELVSEGAIVREEDRTTLRLALNEWSALYI